mmetsp:Transcript_55792/g.179066  ORF Transcript_55792/g.179066 Transcript_55792/m.179066 type:complete len:92 (-) Transcript_55792:1323-1598(-)
MLSCIVHNVAPVRHVMRKAAMHLSRGLWGPRRACRKLFLLRGLRQSLQQKALQVTKDICGTKASCLKLTRQTLLAFFLAWLYLLLRLARCA